MASFEPVDAPEGTAARPDTPDSRTTSASMVGLPRESRISRAMTSTMALMKGIPLIGYEWLLGRAWVGRGSVRNPLTHFVIAHDPVSNLAHADDHFLVRRMRPEGFEIFPRSEGGVEAEVVAAGALPGVPAILPAQDAID